MNSLKGHLLIAAPSLLSPFFAQTVILMLKHDEEGALGVVLNRPLETTITEVSAKIFAEPFDWDRPLYLGGPVPGPLMVLHTLDELADEEVLPGLFQTVEAERVREVIRRKSEPSLILANYAGWGPGQLEDEFGVDSWLTLPATAQHVFRDDMSDLWEEVIQAVGTRRLSDFLGIKQVPEDPSLN